jgi:hypothetical protein
LLQLTQAELERIRGINPQGKAGFPYPRKYMINNISMNPLKGFNSILIKVRRKNANNKADCIQYHQYGSSPISSLQNMDERELAVNIMIQATTDEARGGVKELRVLLPVIF